MKYLGHQRIIFVLCAILMLLSTALAVKQPTSYCKCICFQNSTIIPLNSPPSSPDTAPQLFSRDTESQPEQERDQQHRTLTCGDCNRAFCLDYNLPICKNAKEEDVFSQCFQRDSLKDRTIVTLFLLTTASLLGWALIKPHVLKSGAADVLGRYAPVDGHNEIATNDHSGLPRHNPNRIQRPETTRGESSRSIARQGGLNS